MKPAILYLVPLILLASCSNRIELSIEGNENITLGVLHPLKIQRFTEGRSQENNSQENGFTYYLVAQDKEVQIATITDAQNDRCGGNTINVQANGRQVCTYERNLLFDKKDNGDILVSLDCSSSIYKVNGLDSTSTFTLIIEDKENSTVRDSLVLRLTQ